MEKSGVKIAAQNRKAFHDYFVEDRYEAGIELFGTEVKSIRAGTLNLKDSFCVAKDGEIYAYSLHISPYEQGNIFNRDPDRPKRLLLHKRETGEEPFLTAQRELKEEIGAEAGRWTELGALIASPGCYGETLYLYMAEDLTFGETHPDEDEFLEVLRVPFEEAVRQCMDGTLTDAKTVAAVLKGRLLRERACAPAADAIH